MQTISIDPQLATLLADADTALTTSKVMADDASAEAAAKADYAVANHQVSSVGDLDAKLAFMVARQMGDGIDWLAELLADVRRIGNAESH